VITGFNTDIKHNEKVYHVQTEDKGLQNPYIESLVYVGGEILDSVLREMNLFSRLVVCGLISDYNAKEPYAIKNWRAVLVNRIRVQGMIVFDWKDRYGEALKALSAYVAEGKLKYRESVVEGLQNAPKGLIALLKGQNFGKQLVKLA